MADRRDAFDRMVDDSSPRLLRSAYLLTGDWALAEDLLQTALVKTWFHWRSVRNAEAAPAYVRRTMVRIYASWWRRRWRGEVPTESLPDTARTDPYDVADDQDELRRVLAELRPRVRTMLILRYIEDLTEAQVADLMGCSVGTVKSTVSRGLAALRKTGEQAEPEREEAGYE